MSVRAGELGTPRPAAKGGQETSEERIRRRSDMGAGLYDRQFLTVNMGPAVRGRARNHSTKRTYNMGKSRRSRARSRLPPVGLRNRNCERSLENGTIGPGFPALPPSPRWID